MFVSVWMKKFQSKGEAAIHMWIWISPQMVRPLARNKHWSKYRGVDREQFSDTTRHFICLNGLEKKGPPCVDTLFPDIYAVKGAEMARRLILLSRDMPLYALWHAHITHSFRLHVGRVWDDGSWVITPFDSQEFWLAYPPLLTDVEAQYNCLIVGPGERVTYPQSDDKSCVGIVCGWSVPPTWNLTSHGKI